MSFKKIGLVTAISLVIANMIGTGVFTSLGFQLVAISSPFALLMLWVVGGVIALCGALTYAEIGIRLPRSGGEYNYLSKIYHPSIGFLSGWVSATVGFAAPVALAAMALGNYIEKVFPQYNGLFIAAGSIVILTLIHATNIKIGSLFQRGVTLIKVIIILLFIICGLLITPEPQPISLQAGAKAWDEVFSSAFAVSLVFVSYAYSGWNASSYMAGEIENPKKNLPRSLIIGTSVVIVLYVMLNYVFLYSTPASDLKGYVEIGQLSANSIFGNEMGRYMSIAIALLLVSSISSMIMAGPRISHAMGEDLPGLRFMAIKNRNNIPYVAVILQSSITLVLLFSSKFEEVLTFVGFSLNLFTFLTVLGIFILRKRKLGAFEGMYTTKAFPLPPLIFLALSLWMLYFIVKDKPIESLYGFANLFLGFIVWLIAKRKTPA